VASVIDELSIANGALAQFGGGEIFAFDEETELARKVNAVYEARRDSLLALHAWQFNRRTYKLDEIAGSAENGWDATDYWGNGYRHAFQLPGDAIGTPRRVLTNPRAPHAPLRDYLLEEGRLYADFHPLWASVGVRADPAAWPASFRLAAMVLIASDLAIPVAGDARLAEELRLRGEGPVELGGRGGLVGVAINQDVSGSPGPSPIATNDDLTTAHLS
jgi:hypothetical protein